MKKLNRKSEVIKIYSPPPPLKKRGEGGPNYETHAHSVTGICLLFFYCLNLLPFAIFHISAPVGWKSMSRYEENSLDRSSHRRYSIKKVFLKNFSKLIGKHLRWIPFWIKLQASSRTPFWQSTSGRLLLTESFLRQVKDGSN